MRRVERSSHGNKEHMYNVEKHETRSKIANHAWLLMTIKLI